MCVPPSQEIKLTRDSVPTAGYSVTETDSDMVIS